MSGFEAIEKALLTREKKVVEATKAMTEAGAKVLAEAQSQEVQRTFKGAHSTGALANSIKPTGVKTTATETYRYVYPQGKNSKGERNATVGFVLHYGRTGNGAIRPTHWVTAANEKAAEKVQETMHKVWSDIQK